MKELNQNRGQTYKFLSEIYRVEVGEGFLKSMQADEFLKWLEVLREQFREVDLDLSRGFELLRVFLQDSKAQPCAKVLEDLASDYARLFLLRGGVYPYESVYLGREKRLMEDPWLEIKKMYSSAGLKLRDATETEDHIAFELEFMYQLCRKTEGIGERERGKELLKMQSRFLKDHLSKWVPKLCDGVVEKAATEFYRAVAIITKGFLELDRRIIEQLIEE